MYKFILLPFTIFFCSISFAQTDTIYAELQIKSFSYEGKEIKFEAPKVVILKKMGFSNIVSLGNVNEKEIGIGSEILKSSFGNDSIFVFGIAFFLRENGDWKIGSVIQYQQKNFIKISDWAQINNKNFSLAAASLNKHNSEFEISYRERFYILK
ncbi:MAG: hypothetical protein K2X26_05760 [Chitinophagaceae bacterium]|jgi:hypothetical protein|nr:hypothetical protein [Chitinophagaceae bacterium]